MKGAEQTQRDSRARDAAHRTAITVSLVGFTFAACYFRLFVFPNVPLLPGGDAVGFLGHGARIAAGQLPYRDFFEMLPPGTPYTYALLVRVFGLFTWIPPLVMACLAAATVLLTTLASGRLMRGNVVALPGLLITGPILLASADATHHWFSTVWVLAAMLALLDEVTLPRIAVAGACCGAAACFTQSKGATAVAGLVIYLLWKSWREHSAAREPWRRCLLLGGAALAVFAAVNSYFIGTAGLSRWFYCLVVYPLRYYTAPAINNWRVVKYDFQWHPSPGSWIAFPFVYCTVPLVYIVFLYVMRRRWKKDGARPWDQLLLVALTGMAMFLAIGFSPSVKRLETVSPPAMILLAWLLDRPGKNAAAVRAALGTMAVAVAIAAAARAQTRAITYLDLPAGRTALRDTDAREEYRWVLTHTHPGQFFWGMPPLYVPFHLQNPAVIEAIDTSDYTRPEDVAALLQALRQHDVPIMILVSEKQWPRTVDRPSNHLGPFVAFLHANYRLTRIFANGDELWERTSPAAAN